MDRDEMLRAVEEHYHSFWQGDLDDFDRQLALALRRPGADSRALGADRLRIDVGSARRPAGGGPAVGGSVPMSPIS